MKKKRAKEKYIQKIACSESFTIKVILQEANTATTQAKNEMKLFSVQLLRCEKRNNVHASTLKFLLQWQTIGLQ